jgi:hypothetical protein
MMHLQKVSFIKTSFCRRSCEDKGTDGQTDNNGIQMSLLKIKKKPKNYSWGSCYDESWESISAYTLSLSLFLSLSLSLMKQSHIKTNTYA